ncbi:MAG: hypothetical protein ACREOI_07335 [bacterium]
MRITPFVIVMFLAMQGNWGTHYVYVRENACLSPDFAAYFRAEGKNA